MNWRRGLFRLWIVGSVLFVLAVAFVSYSEIRRQFDDAATIAAHERAGLDPSKDQLTLERASQLRVKGWTDYEVGFGRPPAPWATLGWWAGIALSIPLAVLVLGASLVWAFSGFAAKRS
jgi:hypothetical protein